MPTTPALDAPRTTRRDPECRPDATDAPRPPRLSGPPILGQVLEFLRDPYAIFIRGYREHGPIFRITVPGREFVVLAGAEAPRFLAKHERDLLSAVPIYDDFVRLFGGSRALVNVDGDVHSELRRRFRPTMSRTTFERALPRIADITRARIAALADREMPIERFCRDLVFHQLSAVLGIDTLDADAIHDDLVRVLHVALEVTMSRRWPRFVLRDPRFTRALRRVIALGHDLVRSSEDELVDGLIPVLRLAVRDGLLDERDIPMLSLTPYIAGLDTVASSLAFVLAEGHRDPALHARLRAEVDSATTTHGLGRAWLDAMQLTEAVKTEATRCHPVILTMLRRAERSFTYGGFAVRRGDELLVSIGAQSVMEEYFPDPLRFDPGRFLGTGPKPEQGSFGPYGAGPHACLGASLADVQLVAGLAMMIDSADVVIAAPEGPIATKFDPYPLPKDVRIRVRPRRARV